MTPFKLKINILLLNALLLFGTACTHNRANPKHCPVLSYSGNHMTNLLV